MSEPQGSPAPHEPQAQRTESVMPKREIIVVHNDEVPVFDTGHFEHMYRVALRMSEMSLVPDSLRGYNKRVSDSEKTVFAEYPQKVIVANCLKVVNQARRWGFDPYALLDCVSVVHGKLCYEGKVIHAAIEQCTGIRLKYDFIEGHGQQKGVIVSGQFANETKPRTIQGKVKDWHKGPKSPWQDEAAWERQLRYRGAREWCRAFAPGVLFGVYSIDEIDDLPPLDAPEIDVPPPPPPRLAQQMESDFSAQQAESVDPPPPPPRSKPMAVKGEKNLPTSSLKRSSR
jgi:hypothetical protein